MSSKRSDGIKSCSISTSVTQTNGFNAVDEKLRSILMHPMGMLLTALLNDVAPPNIDSDDFWSVAKTSNTNADFPTYDAADTLDQNFVLADAITKWNGQKEKDLTDTIYSYVDALSASDRIDGYGGQGENSLQFEEQKETKSKSKGAASDEEVGDENRLGTMDFVISEADHKDKSKAQVVAIYEVGIYHTSWWAKTEQILRYVQSIRNSEDDGCKYRVDQPILLNVVTISKNSKDESNKTKNSNAEQTVTRDTNKRTYATLNTEVSTDAVEKQNESEGLQESNELSTLSIDANDFEEHQNKYGEEF